MTFKDLNIIEPILRALKVEGYVNPTPIQAQSIPILLKGKDLLGCAQTGTGKTAAFAIPIIQRLYEDRKHDKDRKVRALVVTPTRELAIQIGESFTAYAKFTGIRNTVIFGGVKAGTQIQALRRGVDVLVATPGRLLDLMNQGYISLKDIKYSVLDEADRMLDMGFIHDIKKIIAKLPDNRQSLFFSATMPPNIVTLSQKLLGNPEEVTVRPEQTTAERVEQAIYYVAKSDKIKLLIHLLETEKEHKSALIFSRTKHGANKIVKLLGRAEITAAAIHGNKSQAARQRALSSFKEGKLKVLIATDIAARGIDVDALSLVINYDLPNIPETYVHRIGRTGRASASGIALSFCDMEERAYLRSIQKTIDQKLPVVDEHPYKDEREEVYVKKSAPRSNNNRRPSRNYRPKSGNSSSRNSSSRRNSNWSKRD